MASPGAHAHNAWLLPSSTILSAPQWITVDAAVSNDLFYFNHAPLGVDELLIHAPGGETSKPESVSRGKLRTTFDANLDKDGTYKIAIARGGVFASWKENGAPKRWRGTAERFAAEVPADAQDLQVNETESRLETFVTVRKPTDTVLKPTGRGLELVPVTHPNDLVADEAATFQLLVDGKPADDLDVTVTPGNVRYRDKLDEAKYKTDANGKFVVKWPGPGMYWLDTDTSDDKTTVKQARQRRLSYAATLEVMPK
ncbi:MAG: DUF4198 domain-containing protein [Burkholderiaceae bacterium]